MCLEELEKREERLKAQEKRVEILGAIQDEITKILGMNNKLMKLADEVVREIGGSSYIEIRICDISMEYTKIHRNITDLLLLAFLDEQEDLRSHKVAKG